MKDNITDFEKQTRVIVGSLPFEGSWLVGNTPAKQVPSHGTDLFGTSYAIDFMAVDEKGRTAPLKNWRTLFSVEPPELFYSFGKQVLSPIDGEIVEIHNGEEDHVSRRNLFTLLSYSLGQVVRIRAGHQKIAGNYVIVKDKACDIFIVIVHLQNNSITVKKGQAVTRGQHIANCGNSGNSTEPHIHIQAMDNISFSLAKGVPLYFDNFIQRTKKGPKEFINSFPSYGSTVTKK